MRAEWLLAAALLAAAPIECGAARAQTMYRGYDVGPDYTAMLNQQMQIEAQRNAAMQQQTEQIVRGAMQDPTCYAFYQQHLAAGGQIAYPQFAYECARNGRFTREGMARAGAAERANAEREHRSWQGLQQAERERGEAQTDYADQFERNNTEFGRGLSGQGSFVDPSSGAARVLPTLRPGQTSVDPQTGQSYVMDQRGVYYTQYPNDGRWFEMTPAR